jgi:cob(I)alamin adenosyltransferase
VEKRGYIHIYTGNGKGKTTAALGLALRAAGHEKSIYIGQFMKGSTCGELTALKKFKNLIKIEQYGKRKCIPFRKTPLLSDIHLARAGLKKAKTALLSGKYDLVILDELNVAAGFHLLDEEEVLTLVREKPENVELVITGRQAPKELIKMADLVSEIKEIKHYYKKGVHARPGIEM